MQPGNASDHPVIAFIGVGGMAEALVANLLDGGWPRARLRLTHRRADRRAELAARFGAEIGADNLAAGRDAGIVVLGTRPQDGEALLRSLRPALRAGQIVVSIAAALTLDWLRARLPEGVLVVRLTPPPTTQVKAGVALMASDAALDPIQRANVERLVQGACERIEWIPDRLMEPVTAVASGLTPYLCMLLDTVIKTGIEQGIEPDFARRVVMDGFWAAARLLHEGGHAPDKVLEMAATREGLTVSALRTMEAAGVQRGIRAGVRAMTGRSYQLRGDPIPDEYRGFKT